MTTRRNASLVALLAIVLAVLVPAAAFADGGSSGNPANECDGLTYLDKWGFDASGSGSWDQSGSTDPTQGDGGISISYTHVDGEVHSVDWTSSTPIYRVWVKAGQDTDVGVAYSGATTGTETVTGNAFSHITFCGDEPEQSTPQPVKPILECVVQVGESQFSAYFGYKNENAAAVDIPVGDGNKVTGGGTTDEDQGQPTTFDAGRTDYVDDAGVFKPANAAFSVDFDGSDLVWTLTGPDGSTRTSTASSNSTRCPEPEIETCPPGTVGTYPDCSPPPPPPPPPAPTSSLEFDAEEVCVVDSLVEVIDFNFSNIENVTTATITLRIFDVDGPDGFIEDHEIDLTVDEQGSIPWPINTDDELYPKLTATVSADGVDDIGPITLELDEIVDECTIVLETPPLERPVEEEPKEEPTPVTEVLDEVEEKEEVTLPKTGVSALVLALLGLLSMGSGGALLRRRPR